MSEEAINVRDMSPVQPRESLSDGRPCGLRRIAQL